MKLDRKYASSLALLVSGIFMLNYVTNLTTETQVSWPYKYEDIKELSEDSDIIIKGYVVSSENILDLLGNLCTPMAFTDYKIQVTQVIKGDIKEKEVIVRQTGGTYVGVKQEISDDPLMQKGTTMILFLKEFDYNQYYITGGPQGRYEVHNNKIYSIGEVNDKAKLATEHLSMRARAAITKVSETDMMRAPAERACKDSPCAPAPR